MNTYREIVYMVLDELKGMSDDFTYTEEHILYLIDKYRAFLLKQKYSDIKKQIPESNYQTVCLNLIETPAIAGVPCEGGVFLRSKELVPNMIKVGNPKVYTSNYYIGEITLVSRERMRYVGHNKYLKNIIYASIGPDMHIYFKSSNPQYLYLRKVNLTAVFEDSNSATELSCNQEESSCDILDRNVPLEDALIAPLIQLIIKDIYLAALRPKDIINDGSDDLNLIANGIATTPNNKKKKDPDDDDDDDHE